MARKKRTSPAEDLMSIVALFPWWVGVVLAVGSYLYFHSLAIEPMPVITAQPGQMSEVASRQLFKALASVCQYLLPIICIAGAGASWVGRRKRLKLVERVLEGQSAAVVDGMSWQDFERLVGEGFRRRGFAVVENGGTGPDGGVDLALLKDGERFLVQCKQWRALKVGVTVVRELYGVMAARGAAGGFVVTSGRFTEEAKAFASGRNVELIDGEQLQVLLRHDGATVVPQASAVSGSQRPGVPQCPVCSKMMVERTAKRGANAGSIFWGCSGYPACKGTRTAA